MKLRDRIIELFEKESSYSNPKWGFSAMGHRSVAKKLNISEISASNAMRAMINNGVFYERRTKDQWSECIYYMRNNKLKS